MKKLLLILFLALTLNNVYSQDRKDDSTYEVPIKNKKELVSVKSPINQAGLYLEKSSKYQYGALGCAGISAGLLISYGCMSDKFEPKNDGKTKLTGKAKGLIIGGSAFALLAIILEANAIDYKISAGKCLRLQSDENGAGLAFVF